MKPLRLGLALALLLGPLAAHAAAGQMLFALGRVEIQRGSQTFSAQRQMPVEVGDTIRTGPTGLAQVRLKDGALLSLRYGSILVIEDFHLPAAAPAATGTTPIATAPPSAAAVGGRSVLRLLRGAFRTVTGLIGKGANDNYSVVTPVATIGIRGTDYSAAYCNADCGTTPDGLYVGVSNGEVELNNDGGKLVLGNDQYGYVKDSSTAPDQELAPPEVLEAPIEDRDEEEDEQGEDGARGEETAAGDEPAPEGSYGGDTLTGEVADVTTKPEGEYELRPGLPGSFAVGGAGFAEANNNGLYLDDTGALGGFLGDGVSSDGFTSIGTAQNVNQGADDATGLRWGRWSGGLANSSTGPVDLSNQSLHWIYASSGGDVALRVTGSATYTLIGNTDPTDTAGNVGFLGSATLDADFTNQTVTSTLNLGINSQVWLASGSGSITSGTPLFDGTYAVTVNDALGAPIGTGTGLFDGFFTSGALGAGLAFDLTSPGLGSTVSGAAAFAESGGLP
ncbi:MAG: FecR family protein [Gammaproteobacteria bacterium]